MGQVDHMEPGLRRGDVELADDSVDLSDICGCIREDQGVRGCVRDDARVTAHQLLDHCADVGHLGRVVL